MLSTDVTKELDGLDAGRANAIVLANAERLLWVHSAYLRSSFCVAEVKDNSEPDLKQVLDHGWNRVGNTPAISGIDHEPEDLWGPIAAFHVKAHIFDVVECIGRNGNISQMLRLGTELIESIGEFYDDGFLACDSPAWSDPVDFERKAIAHDLEILTSNQDVSGLREYWRKNEIEYRLLDE